MAAQCSIVHEALVVQEYVQGYEIFGFSVQSRGQKVALDRS